MLRNAKIRTSSVLNKDSKNYGKQFLIDNNPETCWNSAQGNGQFVQIEFDEPQTLSKLKIQFQGGFCGKNVEIIADDLLLKNIYPTDTSDLQLTQLNRMRELFHVHGQRNLAVHIRVTLRFAVLKLRRTDKHPSNGFVINLGSHMLISLAMLIVSEEWVHLSESLYALHQRFDNPRAAEMEVPESKRTETDGVKLTKKSYFQMLLTALLFQLTSSLQVISSEWIVDDCYDSPAVMYTFNLDTTVNNSTRKKNDTTPWPTMLQLELTNNQWPQRCMSALKAPLSKGCCATASIPKNTIPYRSGSTEAVQDPNNPTFDAPRSAKGEKYCYLKSNNSTVFGYKEAWYRADGGCYDKVMCNSNGTLVFYNDKSCSSIAERNQLTIETQQLNSSIVKAVDASFVEVYNSTKDYSWIASIPTSSIFPDYHYTSDVLIIICYTFASIALIVVIVYMAHNLYLKRTRYVLGQFISQLLWGAWLATRIYSTFCIWTPYIDEAMYSLQNLASLVAVINITWSFLNFLRTKLYQNVVVYSGIIVVHLVLAGPNYYRWDRTPSHNPGWLNDWKKTYLPYWLLIMFIWNCSIPVYVMLNLLGFRAKSFTNQLCLLLDNHAAFCVALVFQLLNMALYITIDQLRNNSEALGGDRAWVASFSYIAFTFALHAALNLVLALQIDRFIEERTNAYSKSKKSSEVESRVSRV
ncbi:hypothetical protein HDV06_005336 [Boothiomyces sp. JEL0866]|nr:hypothetical protein HDV06_005336 [Boothiomyces sp. JEL0866]